MFFMYFLGGQNKYSYFQGENFLLPPGQNRPGAGSMDSLNVFCRQYVLGGRGKEFDI